MIMKKLYALLAGVVFFMLTACHDDDYPVYDRQEGRLNFLFYDYWGDVVSPADATDEMRLRSFSFKLESGTAMRDTVWLEAETMGFVGDEARSYALEQVLVDGVKNAEPGVHYVAFDSPEIQSLYRVEAFQSKVKVPVVVLRDDAGLKDTTVVLKITFKDNGVFRPGYVGLDTRVVEITDRLAEPMNWEECYLYYVVGDWGELKHEKMIEWTGKTWDNEYIEEFMDGDSAYRDYIASYLKKKLKEENALREERGEGPLTEKDGTPVDFAGHW